MAVVDTKDEKLRAESVPAASPSAPEPEFHVTFVDTALPPVSLFRQIRERLREPKNAVPKTFPSTKGSPVPGAEFHATFVDTTLPPISLFRQIRQRFREPKVPLQSEYYRRGADAESAGSSVVSGGEFHATFVERTLPPVSLFRQIVAGIHEPKTPAPIKPGHVTLPPTEVPPLVPEDPNQLNLFASPETAYPAESKPLNLPAGWQDYHIVMVVDPEAVKWRRRTMYLSSLILHFFLLLVLLFSPDLLRRGRMMIGLPVQVAPKQQNTFLLLPPDVPAQTDRAASGEFPTLRSRPQGARPFTCHQPQGASNALLSRQHAIAGDRRRQTSCRSSRSASCGGR